jgi:hypothetical protein
MDREGGLEQLSGELTRIALDAQGGFGWDASRPPYPGLLAFQEEDAALYFGRDDDIRRLIERLNARRSQGGTKLIALLGASGSGKSSLLRAGVIPRLKRAGRNWVVLPPMRPQVRPVDEMARSLAVACGGDMDWRKLREDLNGDNLALTLSDIANDLRINAGANEAQILLPIDQSEELFGAADPDQALRFFEILNVAMANDLPFIAVMALRSDYLGLLQSAERLTARFEEFSLGPMPLARIPQIIEGPARVAGLNIDEAFVHQAARDAQTEDALPLLAFALRELYDRAADDNYLSLDEYNALGDPKEGLTPLENAVRKAADDVLTEARPSEEELTALREAFVPAMVRVNEQGEYVRRPAHWDDLPSKAHALLEKLAKARLLIVSQDGDDRMIEVAHEALLRKWPRLRTWLDDAREFLSGKQQLERDLNDWHQAAEEDKTGALLSGLKLNRAQGWFLERPHQLTAEERFLIKASIDHAEAEEKLRQAEQERRLHDAEALAEANKKTARRTKIGLLIASVLFVLAGGAGTVAYVNQIEAQNQARQAVEAKQATINELISISWKAGALLNEDTPDRSGHSWLPGSRKLYNQMSVVMDFSKLKSLSPVPIFLNDVHGDVINLESADFGRYNPKFLTWANEKLIPAAGNALLREATQPVYNKFLKPMVRTYYIAYGHLEDHPGILEKAIATYEMELESYKKNTKVYEKGCFSCGPGAPLQAVFHGYADDQAEKYQWTGDLGLYNFSVAPAYWVRRHIDGTSWQFFKLLKKLIQTYDPEFLNTPEALAVQGTAPQ